LRERFLSFGREDIEGIFEEFYKTLFSDRYIKHFFESQEQIQNLIKKQILFIQRINLLNEKDDPEFEEHIKKVVNIHHNNNIPFELFINSLEYLKELFIKHLAHKDSELKVYISNLFDNIEKISSKHYATILLEEEKEVIMSYQKMYKKFLEKNQFNIITFHLSWLLTLTNKFLKEEPVEIYIDEKTCFFNKINNNQEYLQDYIIGQLHKKIHESAGFLHYLFFEKKDYRNFIHAYSNLCKEVYNFTIALVNKLLLEEQTKSRIDPLTKLYNRRNLEKIVNYQLKTARILNLKIALLMLDIDNFKQINDKYGHIVGDKVLQEIANIIRKNIRKTDYAFRYGGEEFLVILPAVDKKTAYKIAEKIRTDIEKKQFKIDSENLKITVSIGVAILDKETLKKDLKTIIEKVDKALYTAKNNGKNQVVIEH